MLEQICPQNPRTEHLRSGIEIILNEGGADSAGPQKALRISKRSRQPGLRLYREPSVEPQGIDGGIALQSESSITSNMGDEPYVPVEFDLPDTYQSCLNWLREVERAEEDDVRP